METNAAGRGKMLRIVAPDFVAGIVLTVETEPHADKEAPKVRFMHGWSEDKIRKYCGEHRWAVDLIDPFATT